MAEDRFLTCQTCGNEFLWLAREQAKGAAPPAWCPACRRLLPEDGRRRGVVKFYNLRKGWGFVTQPDGAEVFFHRSAFLADLHLPAQEGDLLEYGVEETARGLQAVAVERLGDVSEPAAST